MKDLEMERIKRSIGYRLFYLLFYGPGDLLRMIWASLIYGIPYLYAITITRMVVHVQIKRNWQKFLKSM